MKSIEESLKPLEGYLISINRNAVDGWYELEIGLPKGWIYKSNDLVECEEIQKTDKGVLLKITPKNENVIVDDLISFVALIMETNSNIAKKEEEFSSIMEKVKKDLENQAKAYYEELDKMREESFKNFNTNKKKTTTSSSKSKKTEAEKSSKTTNKKDDKSDSTKKRRGRPPKDSTVNEEEIVNESNEQKEQ